MLIGFTTVNVNSSIFSANNLSFRKTVLQKMAARKRIIMQHIRQNFLICCYKLKHECNKKKQVNET